MAKKLKVWLNNKLNKCLHCTVVIKFYRIFVTELVYTFFVFKYQNHFEFPKDGKLSPHLKILEIPGGRGGHQRPLWNRKSWGVGGCKSKSLLWGGVWIFSGTTQSNRYHSIHCICQIKAAITSRSCKSKCWRERSPSHICVSSGFGSSIGTISLAMFQ